MIIQFILRLIFFYCVFALLKSLIKRYTKPAAASNQANYNRRSSSNDSNVFEAEYKVVKEDSDS